MGELLSCFIKLLMDVGAFGCLAKSCSSFRSETVLSAVVWETRTFFFYTAGMKSFLQLMFISWPMKLALKGIMYVVKYERPFVLFAPWNHRQRRIDSARCSGYITVWMTRYQIFLLNHQVPAPNPAPAWQIITKTKRVWDYALPLHHCCFNI